MSYVAPEAPLRYRLMQRLVWFLFRVLTRFHISGWENVPATGPVIVSPNHLHSFDIALTGMIVPRQTAIMAAEKWQGQIGGLVMQAVTPVIYVQRGEVDRAALNKGLAVLKQGGTLAVAPEGTRSKTGGLLEGKDGAVYLASRSGAVIMPVAVWGHENALPALRRLRRAEVHCHVLPPFILPPGAERARTPELRAHTEALMLTLARALPEQYRGVYGDKLKGEPVSQDEPAAHE